VTLVDGVVTAMGEGDFVVVFPFVPVSPAYDVLKFDCAPLNVVDDPANTP
jgi:hypothetical protein